MLASVPLFKEGYKTGHIEGGMRSYDRRMPEILGGAGIYFDPLCKESIIAALRELGFEPKMRANLARRAYRKAQRYSWERCADETFKFIKSLVKASP